MITSKFNIGQQVRHRLFGYLGVIIDIDAQYSLDETIEYNKLSVNESLRNSPWYHVVMENEKGQTTHIYLAEAQLDHEASQIHPEQPDLDELSETIKQQYQHPKSKN